MQDWDGKHLDFKKRNMSRVLLLQSVCDDGAGLVTQWMLLWCDQSQDIHVCQDKGSCFLPRHQDPSALTISLSFSYSAYFHFQTVLVQSAVIFKEL